MSYVGLAPFCPGTQAGSRFSHGPENSAFAIARALWAQAPEVLLPSDEPQWLASPMKEKSPTPQGLKN